MFGDLPDQAVKQVLARIAEGCRQARIRLKHTQAEQAALAEISLRAAQNIESGQAGQTAILFKYLHSLGLLSEVYEAFPDPDALTPLEALAVQKKAQNKRPQRVSKTKGKPIPKPRWGDES